ncbi:MAG TPA: FUSC family protein, partial [Jatrophihabitans sp.]|nr:FUSC family protein [Jatrophihabitans sp.]
ERLSADGQERFAELVRDSLTAAASVLDEVAYALERGAPVREEVLDAARTTLRAAIAELSAGADPADEPTRLAAVGRLRALSGQLRAVVESTRAGASEGRMPEAPTAMRQRLRDPLAIVRANLDPQSAVLRHAIRLSVLVAGSDLLVRAAHLDRGYWLPLTILVVLRPDFATTFQRSVMRVAGTIVGVLIATALVHWVPGGDWWQVALIAVFAFGMRLSGPGNIALSAVCLSALVVILLQISGVPAHTSVIGRAYATLAGGAVAVLAAVAWPAWERGFVPSRLADLLGAYARYVRVVADLRADRAELQRARAACRLARSNAQASVDRAQSEPVRGQAQVELGRAVLAHTHRFVHAMLAVEALRIPVREAGGLPELAAFLEDVARVLDHAREAVLAGTPPADTENLREQQVKLAALLLAEPERVGGVETATALVDATDRITDSLDTLLEELRRQLPLG